MNRKALSVFLVLLAGLAVVSLWPGTAGLVGRYDKLAHLVVYAILAVIALQVFTRLHFRVLALVGLGLFGVLIELFQYFKPDGEVSAYDAAANLAGLALGGLAVWAWQTWRNPSNAPKRGSAPRWRERYLPPRLPARQATWYDQALFHTLGGLEAAALIGFIGYWTALSQLARDGQIPPFAMQIPVGWVWGFLLVVSLYLGLAALLIWVHESGHVLGGWLAGFKLWRFVIGPFSLERRFNGRLALTILLRLNSFSGAVMMHLPATTAGYHWRTVVMVASAGGLNILAGLVCILIGFAWPGLHLFWQGLLVFFGLMNILGGLYNLYPLGSWVNMYSDGMLLRSLVGRTPHAAADGELIVAQHQVYSLLLDGVLLVKTPPEYLEKATRWLEPPTGRVVSGQWLAYFSALAMNQPHQAEEALRNIFSLSRLEDIVSQNEMMIELAYFSAFFHHDASAARFWLRQVNQRVNHSRPALRRAQAAVALAEGNREEARSLAASGLAVIYTLQGPLAHMESYLLRRVEAVTYQPVPGFTQPSTLRVSVQPASWMERTVNKLKSAINPVGIFRFLAAVVLPATAFLAAFVTTLNYSASPDCAEGTLPNIVCKTISRTSYSLGVLSMPSHAQNPSNLGLSWLDSMMALSISADPAWSPPLFKQAQSAYYQGNPMVALGSLRLANRFSPHNQNYTWAWINLTREIGDPQLIIEACSTAAANFGDSPQYAMIFWLCQADAQVMLNDYPAAETAFRQALAAQPNAPAALCGYAYFALFNLENPTLALDLFNQASADPDAVLFDDCTSVEEVFSLP